VIVLTKILVSDFPFEFKDFVGTLLFHELIATSIYSSIDDRIIIKEWIDCSNDGAIDRYFYYTTSRTKLKDFLAGRLSHLEFIDSADRGFLFFEDLSDQSVIERSLVSVNDFPVDYKPDSTFYLKKEEIVDYKKIYDYFYLDSVDDRLLHKEKVEIIANNDKAETYDLHVEKGFGVDHGTIESSSLARLLGSFDSFYKEVSLDSIKGKDRGKIYFTKKNKSPDKVKLRELCSTIVYRSIAASFSILIKPMATSLSVYNDASMTEPVAINLFSLINSSVNRESLNEEVIKFSSFTLAAFEEFIKIIHEQNLSIDFNWFNPTSNNRRDFSFNYDNSSSILHNIKSLNTISDDTVTKKGKFRAINLNNGSFLFVSEDGQEFSGMFDKDKKEGLYIINFVNIFQTTIRTTVQKMPGKKDPVRTSTILSYFIDTIQVESTL
jgi:hypothetical protein